MNEFRSVRGLGLQAKAQFLSVDLRSVQQVQNRLTSCPNCNQEVALYSQIGATWDQQFEEIRDDDENDKLRLC